MGAIRSENVHNRAIQWYNQQYFGIYFMINKNQPLAAIANNRAYLILRFPLWNVMKLQLWPLIEDKIQPFKDTYYIMINNPKRIPHLITYFDKFLLDFDNEFECSNIIRKSKLESDLITNEINQRTYNNINNLNEYLIEQCIELNNFIVDENFKHEDVRTMWKEARNYLRQLLSNRGENRFRNTWSGIF